MHWLSPYSLLDWDPEAHRSWSLPVSVKRIPSHLTAAEMGITQVQYKETGDRWSWLVALAVWLLLLSRPIVEDHPLPWQKPQRKLTPQRVQRRLPLIFAQFGSPARTPKMRAKSPGWPKDRHRTPKQRFKVVKKHPEPLYFDCQSTIFST